MLTTQLWGCAKCATLGKTCCQICEVLVTVGDQQRIRLATRRTDFWEYRIPADPSYLDQADDPNWLRWAFRADGSRPVLKRVGGNCVFLGPNGCTLHMEVRPLVCRLYPYAYTEAGLNGICDACPPAVVPPGLTILNTLGMCHEDAVRWHRMLYNELRTKGPCHEGRTDVRLAG